ncbi:MAG TPA: outer membrane beta-barrel protein, partial [Pirellulales bacterium]
MNHCRFFTIFTLAMLGASMPAALQAQSPNVGAASNQADTGGDQWRSSRLNWSGRDAAPDNQLRGASGAASRDVGGPTSSSVAVPSMTPLPEQSVSFRAAPATPSVATAAIQPSAPVANPNATPPANPFAAPATNPNVAPPANSFITPAANPNAAPISSNRLIEARKPEDIQNAPSGAPWNGNTVQEASYEPQMGPYPQSNASATPAGGYDSAPRDYYRTFSKYAPSDGYSPEVREWARRESASSTRKQPRASGGILSSASLVRAGRPGVNRSMQNRGGVRTVSYAPQMAPQGQSGQMSGPIMGDYEELPPGGNSSADGYSQGYGGTTSGDYVVDEYDSLGYPTGFYDQNGCVQNGCVPQCYPADNMCHLFECCWTKQRGIFIGGWTTQSYTWNPGRPADRFNGPVTMTDRSNDYQLNQQYLYLDRPTFTDGEGLDVGGRADMLFGTDARFTTTEGLENGVNRNNNSFYQLAFPQFYGEVAYNNLKVRMGHFYSPTGYFSVPTVNNFFNSLPYTFQYGEPFTQFGLLATWTANQHWTIGAGFNRGWDNMTGGNPNL